MSVWAEITRIESGDGKHRMLVERNGDLFRFVEETFFSDDKCDYWAPTSWSGLYASSAEAEAAALVELPWLRAQISN